jgi:hypothetical protein
VSLRSPSWLIVTIIIISEAAQVASVHMNGVDFATIDVIKLVEISSEHNPLAIRGKLWALTVAAGR